MGVLFASLLEESADVTVFSRHADRSRLRNEKGIRVLGREGEILCHPEFTADRKGIADSDLIIIFLKAAATKAAIAGYLPYIPDDAYVMTLQNGAGHFEELERFFRPERIIIGTTEHNASIIDDSSINHGGSGPTAIGMKGGILPDWIPALFRASSIELLLSDDIMGNVWRKLLTNASLSTATALLMCSIDEIGRSRKAFSLVERLLAEAVRAASADGYAFSYEEIVSGLWQKTQSASNAYTSIYADLKAGRMTEVDYISGYVVKRAMEKGIDVPYQQSAVDIIHAKEELSNHLLKESI